MEIYKINDKLCRINSYGAIIFCQEVDDKGKDIKGEDGVFALDQIGLFLSHDKTKGIEQFLFKTIE